MNKIIHFFDLDDTLWSIETKVWVIFKDKPNTPIIKLNTIQLDEILNGVYKKEDNMIEYNGNTYWISDEMFDRIKKRKSTTKIEDLGISFIEDTNPMYFNKIKIYIDNIRHLVGKNEDIGILSSRYSIENDHKLLNTLKEELSKYDLEICKFYYTSDYYNTKNTNKKNIDKMKILLEHLVGFHIFENRFVPIKQDLYQEVHFYDDEFQNINVANDIQHYFEEYLKDTEDEVFNKIKGRIKLVKPILYTHIITNNRINRFKTNKIELKEPIIFAIKVDENITYKFKDFINKKYK